MIRRSTAAWIWRGVVTVLLIGLPAWGGLGGGYSELLSIVLGTGVLIMVADAIRNIRNRRPSRPTPSTT